MEKADPSSNLIVVLLPEPFGPEQTEYFALLDFEIERLEGADFLTTPEVPIHLAQVSRLDDDFAAGRGCGRTFFGCHGCHEVSVPLRHEYTDRRVDEREKAPVVTPNAPRRFARR